MGRKSDDTKIKKKDKAVNSLYIYSTYFFRLCLEQYENKKKDQGDSNWKGKSQTFVICRDYDSM